MTIWPAADAKARFGELLDTCLAEGPQIVTRRGAEAAVLVSIADWRRLAASSRPTLKQLLLSDEARVDGLARLPRRLHRRVARLECKVFDPFGRRD